MENKTSDAQIRASRNWEANNKEKARYGSYKRTARLFIKKYLTAEDLEEFRELIETRANEL